MLSFDRDDEVSDTTGDDSSNADGLIKQKYVDLIFSVFKSKIQ
jgi:hypothetical protein